MEVYQKDCPIPQISKSGIVSGSPFATDVWNSACKCQFLSEMYVEDSIEGNVKFNDIQGSENFCRGFATEPNQYFSDTMHM